MLGIVTRIAEWLSRPRGNRALVLALAAQLIECQSRLDAQDAAWTLWREASERTSKPGLRMISGGRP